MNQTINKKGIIIGCTALIIAIAAMVFALIQFGPKDLYKNEATSSVQSTGEASPSPEVYKKKITVEIIFKDKTSKTVDINTNADSLRKALEEQNLIEGDESEYGLYVKKVDGVIADFDADKAFWSFSKNGTELMTGVDQTPVTDGDKFEITYTVSNE